MIVVKQTVPTRRCPLKAKPLLHSFRFDNILHCMSVNTNLMSTEPDINGEIWFCPICSFPAEDKNTKTKNFSKLIMPNFKHIQI